MSRETGGNRIYPADLDRTGLAAAVSRGLHDLQTWADDTDRTLDLAQVTVETTRTNSGQISVSVTADLVGGCGDHDCSERHGGRR